MTVPDLSYLAEDLRPQVADYLKKMQDLRQRSWDEGNAAACSLATRCYHDALGKISRHEWPL